MSYINRRAKVFMAGESKVIVPVRSEARMKNYFSTTDARAWSDIPEERRQHILEYAAKNKEGFCLDKFIPLEIVFNAMMAGKNTELKKLRKKMECLEKIIDTYTKIELTDTQQRQLKKLRSEIEKVYGKLDCLQSVTAIIETRRRLDSGEYSEGKSKSKRGSVISGSNDDTEPLNDIIEISGRIDSGEYSEVIPRVKRESIISGSSTGTGPLNDTVEAPRRIDSGEYSEVNSKNKRESIISGSSTGSKPCASFGTPKKIDSGEYSEIESKNKRESIISGSSNGTKPLCASFGPPKRDSGEYSEEKSKNKRGSIVSGGSIGAELDKISEISETSKETRSTNTDTINSQDILTETEKLKCTNQTAYCDICPCVNELEIECMKKELDNLKSKCKEAEMLKLERDKLQIELNELSYLQVQYDNLRLKCCCLEGAAQERDMYKQKYGETLSSDCECEKLRSQVEATKDLARERDDLAKQVNDLKTFISKQEEEMQALVAQVYNLTHDKDEIQNHTNEAISSMRAEVEEKDQIIAALQKKLPALQAKMKNSVKRVSCKITCLKTRIKELEENLGQSKSENEELKKQVEDNEMHLKGAMQLVKCEYEALCAMKREVETAQAENQKLQQIANKMIALTADENVKKVLRQSECAINRAVEELQKQYKEWDYLRSNKKEDDFTGDASNKVICLCKAKVLVAEKPESNDTLDEELDEIQREKEKLEKLVDQIKNDELPSSGPQLLYTFKNSLCKFTRIVTEEDKILERSK